MGNNAFLSIFIAALAVVVPFIASAADEKIIAASGPSRVALIELYSSESCSSCPPADQWISSLDTNKELWSKFVPIAFHVDYWNHLNWKDTFSSKEMTARQINVSNTWSSPSVYTPAVVVNGTEKRNWRSASPESHLATTPSAINLQILRNLKGDFIVQATGLKKNTSYIVHLAKLGLGVESKITKGENSGKTLVHNFVVLDWQHQALVSTPRTKPFTLTSDNKALAKRYAVVAWIEETLQPISLQTTGAYL